MDPERVTKELEAVMNEVWVEEDPALSEFVGGKLSRAGLATVAPSYCYQVEQFKRCVAAVYVAAEPRDVRLLMLENLHEEHGEGDPSRDHTELAARFARALGAEIPDPFDIEPIPESRQWVERILNVCTNEHFVVGLAALSYGIEARTRTMGFLADLYHTKYGLAMEDLEFFTMHIGADEEHAARAIEMVRTYCTTEELLERSKWGVREVLAAHASVGIGMMRGASSVG